MNALLIVVSVVAIAAIVYLVRQQSRMRTDFANETRVRVAEVEAQWRVHLAQAQQQYNFTLQQVRDESKQQHDTFVLQQKAAQEARDKQDLARYQAAVTQANTDATNTATEAARVQLADWIKTNETRIRQDAAAKSLSVTVGKVTEHFLPYLPDFAHNPKDARFLGSPIDFVVFDGLAEDKVNKVIFIEVKTGKSQLTSRERSVRDAIQAGRVEYESVRLAQPTAPTNGNGHVQLTEIG